MKRSSGEASDVEPEVEEASDGGWFFWRSQPEFLRSQTECGGDEQRSSPVDGENRKRTIAGSGSFMGRDLWERVARMR